MSSHRAAHSFRAAFTMVELLAVMVVLSILLLVSMPSLVNSTGGSRLTIAGDLLLNALSEAQQKALASDSEVEVRFFENQEPSPFSGARDLTSFQVFTLASTVEDAALASFTPSSGITKLPEGVVISRKDQINSLLQQPFKEQVSSDGKENAKRYLAIRFLPDGSTSLSSGQLWYITLVAETSEEKGEIPVNYYTVQLDPVTGRLRTFRP